MTTKQSKHPPSVMKGYKPETVRYIWFIHTTEGTSHSGMTLGGIKNVTGKQGKQIQNLMVCDLSRLRVYQITDVDRFLDLWSQNYFNMDWKVPMSIRE